LKKNLSSRKLWVAIITSALLWVSAVFDLGITWEQAGMVATPVSAWLLGESYIDAKH